MNTVKSFFHKHLKVVIPVFFLLYLIIGACAPFFYYQSLSLRQSGRSGKPNITKAPRGRSGLCFLKPI